MLTEGQRIGAYTLTRKLGEGGMGQVYLAEHRHLARRAAVKVLRDAIAGDQELVARFFAEAKAASTIRHPGIVEILDCDTDRDTSRAYIVMEYLEGENLETCLSRVGNFANQAPLAIDIIVQTANALAAAHAQGIVHRDLKPANVFLAATPAGFAVKVLDFGIAKLVTPDAPTRTKTGSLLGTPVYMSPEQCRGSGTVDHRSDIYSLGCMAYELLSGRPPFVKGGAGDLVIAHVSETPPPLSRWEPSTAGALETIIMSMLEKDPAARPQSMMAIAAALGAGRAAPVPQAVSPVMTVPLPVATTPLLKAPALPARADSRLGSTTLSDTASEVARAVITKSGNRRLFQVALVASPLLLAGGLWVTFSNRASPPQPTPAVVMPVERDTQPRPSAVKPPPAASDLSPPPPRDVVVKVDTEPKGATVQIEGEEAARGRTPLTLRLPPDGPGRVVVLSMLGYRARRVVLEPNENRTIELRLERDKPPRAGAARGRKTTPETTDFVKLKD